MLQFVVLSVLAIPAVLSTNTYDGQTCYFPFTLNGIEYNECTTNGSKIGLPWCYTSENYTLDGLYGYCMPDPPTPAPASTEPKECAFPFIYNSKIYTECTTVDNYGVQWCSTTNNYDQDKDWKLCEKDEKKVAECVLPFIYKGEIYDNCTTADNYGVAWCSTTMNYDLDEQWMLCTDESYAIEETTSTTTTEALPVFTKDGKRCSLPFVYDGEIYEECTTYNSRRGAWCSLTPIYEGDYGYCA